MKDYASYSFWLETSGDDLTPRPRLDGSIAVDVAVMGAGYTGLWTAYYLLKRDPSLRVAVVEREIAGFGASGRNGGWCTPGFPVSVGLLRERFGTDAARAVSDAMFETIDEIERVIGEDGIDAQWSRGGALRLARGEHQRPSIEGAYRAPGRARPGRPLRVAGRRAGRRARVRHGCRRCTLHSGGGQHPPGPAGAWSGACG